MFFLFKTNNECKKNVIDELEGTIHLFKTSCIFIHKHLKLKTFRTNFSDRECQSLFNLNHARRKYPQIDKIEISDYNVFSQYELIKKAIELSLVSHFNQLVRAHDEDDCFLFGGFGGSAGSDSSASATSSTLLNNANKHNRLVFFFEENSILRLNLIFFCY